MYLMSAPAAKARSPAPVTTTTRACGVLRELTQVVAQRGQRVDVEGVQRVGAVDSQDGDAALARQVDAQTVILFFEEVDDLARVRARREDLGHPESQQFLGVLARNRAAHQDQHVLGPVLLQPVQDSGDEGHVRSGEDRDADGVGVLLNGGLDDLLRRLMKAGVDHLHPGVAKRACDDLGAAVMAVETGFCDHDSNLSCHAAEYWELGRREDSGRGERLVDRTMCA